jgi:hypothetical protein
VIIATSANPNASALTRFMDISFDMVSSKTF